MDKIITIPFGYLLDWLYQFTTNYGVALILFAVVVQAVMMPINAKSKKSTMKMARLQPRIQEIQRRYPDDKQKQNEEIAKLQKEEGAGLGCSGCLWSFLPLLILIPLYQVVRQPIVYMLHQDTETAQQIVEIVKNGLPDLFGTNAYYHELTAISNTSQFASAIKEKFPDISQRVLEGLNFNFLGINLGAVPSFNIFAESWKWEWSFIGGALIPILSAGQQVLSMLFTQKSNNSVVTDKNGMQDKEMAEKSQANQTNKVMTWMMPIISLWIGFTVPCALSLYWLAGGLFRMLTDIFFTKRYRKEYDIEDAERLKKFMEAEAIEQEKERQRAERRAANPDGITENTSKKKLQKQQQQAEDAAKAAAAKEYAAKKQTAEAAPEEEKQTLSGIADRPYCKGRAYDPNRYSTDTTEE